MEDSHNIRANVYILSLCLIVNLVCLALFFTGRHEVLRVRRFLSSFQSFFFSLIDERAELVRMKSGFCTRLRRSHAKARRRKESIRINSSINDGRYD